MEEVEYEMLKVKQTDKIKISPLVLNRIWRKKPKKQKTNKKPPPNNNNKNFQDNSNVQLDFKSDHKW